MKKARELRPKVVSNFAYSNKSRNSNSHRGATKSEIRERMVASLGVSKEEADISIELAEDLGVLKKKGGRLVRVCKNLI